MIDENMFIKELYKFADEEIEKSEEMYKAKNFDMLMQHKYGENCFYKAIQKAKDMPKVGEWIPCSERLPKNLEKALTCDEEKSIHIMVHHESFEYPFGIHPDNPQYSTPVAWMPLPDPYKGVEE